MNHPAPLNSRRERNDQLWEHAVFAQLLVLIIGTSWAFGGQAPWVRTLLNIWGTVGIALFVILAGRRQMHGQLTLQPLRHLWPLLVFDVLVLTSVWNPSAELITRAGEQFYRYITPRHSWWPSSAQPELTLRELWMLNGIVISCYNIIFVLQRRRPLRRLLYFIAVNALALAIFGTFQKLMRSPGLWFGTVPSPNNFFFSTFIYHNHWGAFTILNVGVCLALLFHALRREEHRDFWHTPALAGAVVTLLLAATAPLSGSRSSSVLLALFLFGAIVHFLIRIARNRRAHHESPLLPFIGVGLMVALALGGIFALSRNVIAVRAEHTMRQLAEIKQESTLNQRLRLYRDTWEMAAARPVFGWGLETYGHVFMIYNSAPDPGVGGWKPYYSEAHNDWLQSLAETGFVGTVLIVALVLIPLAPLKWRRVQSNIPRYLLAGCGIIGLYAWLEFPFANPSVLIAFWSCLYIAAAYARLDLNSQRPTS